MPSVLSEFASASTVHGIAYIFANKTGSRSPHLLERALWLLVVCGALATAVFWSRQAYENWRQEPVITTVATMGYPIEKVPIYVGV